MNITITFLFIFLVALIIAFVFLDKSKALGFFEIAIDEIKRVFNLPGHKDLYLEKIRGKKAIEWVEKQNSRTLKKLSSDSRFLKIKDFALSVYESDKRLIYGRLINNFIYTFRTNKKYKRGILKRTALEDYLSGKYQWEEILDLDALAEAENENWVYVGMIVHYDSNRVLIKLSRGGKDAVVLREFDLVQKKFIERGFNIPESKSSVVWLSKDEIVLATDWKNEASLTNSGYPRSAKILKRGESLGKAVSLLQAKKTDVGIFPNQLKSDKGIQIILEVRKDAFSREYFLVKKDRQISKIPLPLNSEIYTHFQGSPVILINKDWIWKNQKYKSGSFLIVHPEKMIKEDSSSVALLMEPSLNIALFDAYSSKNKIYINVLEDVKSSFIELKPHLGKWESKKLPLPSFSSLFIEEPHPNNSDVFFSSETFLEPKRLYHYNDISEKMTKIQSAPRYFDSKKYEVNQFFAESVDKRKIPYLVVSKKNIKRDGKNPTLIYAYGGFGLSALPFYSPVHEFAWYREEGVFVLANIRGGGEYGPSWHQEGLQEKRQTVFNDFYAVAEDLIQKNITSPPFLGIQGGSNGGLLMGVAVTQKPDLFRAAVIQVPILDMLRYHKLLAGSSWIAEYGDPKEPKMREFLNSYSPYQNLKLNVNYPDMFLSTSTLDDRVHPGHARRFVRKLEKLGKAFYYYENSEGGHAGSSNNEQFAILTALECTYLYQKLKDQNEDL